MTLPEATDETTRLLQAKLRVEARAKGGASWFFWIAGLSLVNSIVALAGGDFLFIMGLGVSQFVDALASAIETELSVQGPGFLAFTALAFSLVLAGLFATIGYVARKGNRTIFVIGIILYALDTLFCLALQLWLATLFHLLALAGLFGGLSAMRKLQAIEAGTVPASSLLPPAPTLEERRRASRRIILGIGVIVLIGLIGFIALALVNQ